MFLTVEHILSTHIQNLKLKKGEWGRRIWGRRLGIFSISARMRALVFTQLLAFLLFSAAGWSFWVKQYQLPACEMTYVRSCEYPCTHLPKVLARLLPVTQKMQAETGFINLIN